jgi:HK97 family phage prohead protease
MTVTDELELPPRFDEPQYRRAQIEGVEDRVIMLRAVPYDVEAEVDRNLFESFEVGAFANAQRDPARVKLWFGHSDNGGKIVGQAESVEDRDDGVVVRARISATPAGDELRTLALDHVLDEASIEFRPIPRSMMVRRDGDAIHVRHKRAHLSGVALVPEGAYGRDALVLSVREYREQRDQKRRLETLARLRTYSH